MSDAPFRLVARRPAPPGSPAGDLVAGRGPVTRLLEGTPAPRPFRLDPELLRISGTGAAGRLEAIRDGRGFLVSTGQQPVLFLGPLYVLYKALTAIAVAETLTESGTPSLALFWVASDDHDWEEVGTTTLLDTGNELRRLTLPPPGDRKGSSVGATLVPETIDRWVDELGHVLPESEFAPSCIELLRDAYRPGESLGEAFGRTLSALLAPRPFARVDSASPALRERAAPLLERVLRDPDGVDRALEEGTARVRGEGYPVQLHHARGSPPLFEDRPEGRTRVRPGEHGTAEELIDRLREAPRRFSPGAALRPVVESWLLPVGATVLGPSEVAYWAQLPALFAWAEVPLPRVLPRLSWTIVERKVERVLEKLEVDASVVEEDGGEALIRRRTEAGRPAAVDGALREARSRCAAAMDGMEKAVERELPGIRSTVGAVRHQIFERLEDLEKEVDHRVRERQEVLNRQIRKAALHLRPDGRVQERVLSPFYYLARYGRDFVRSLDAASRARVKEPPFRIPDPEEAAIAGPEGGG